MMIAVAALTTLVYPVFYEALYNDLNVAVAVLLTLRNLLLMALLAWSLGKITALARAGKISESEVRPEPAP